MICRTSIHRCCLSLALCALSLPALAGDIVYTPVNPSFGGSPLNTSHLLAIAGAQKNATASDYEETGGGTTGTATRTSDADLFVRQLQNRLLSALANEVTDAIFGDDPQDSGTVKFGDTTITFDRSLDSIRLVIVDDAAGTTTEIVVPQLVTGAEAGVAGLSALPALSSGSALSPLTIN